MSSTGVRLVPGELWSLWDMLKLNAGEFYVAVTLLQESHTYIDALNGHDEFVEPEKVVADEVADHITALANDLLKSLQILDAKVTAIAVKNLLMMLGSKKLTYGALGRIYSDINSRLQDELSLVQVFVMDTGKARYFSPSSPLFGQEVADKFPHAIPDIEDAGKCLALGQGTATVYHLMRVMEHGLRAIGLMLGIEYAPSWEAYLKQIRKNFDMPRADKEDWWKKAEPFFREVEGDLTSVKIVWRNPTMHIHRRFSPQEAEEIFSAVKAFMTRIATKAPEPEQESTSVQ